MSMRVEITEPDGKKGHAISTIDPDTVDPVTGGGGRLYVQSQGDVITVPDRFGALLCSRGWAKDVDGKVPSAERKPGAVRVAPVKVKHNTKGG